MIKDCPIKSYFINGKWIIKLFKPLKEIFLPIEDFEEWVKNGKGSKYWELKND